MMNYSERLTYLHALFSSQTIRNDDPTPDLTRFNALDAADYLSCYFTFNAIKDAERSPLAERTDNFDMLSVYQSYALLIFAFLAMPLKAEEIEPNFTQSQIVIAKTLFAGLVEEELAEIIEAGFSKFQLIADADAEHWKEYRESLDKVTVSFIVVATDEDSPHDKAEILPLFGQLLSQLCEAFESI
jgi:hypothetical protein